VEVSKLRGSATGLIACCSDIRSDNSFYYNKHHSGGTVSSWCMGVSLIVAKRTIRGWPSA
jgi:hypothetical protein